MGGLDDQLEQTRSLPIVTVRQQIQPVDALSFQLTSVGNDLVDGSIKNAGVAVNMTGKWIIPYGFVLQIRRDGGKEYSSHQNIKAQLNGQLRAAQSLFFRKAHNFEEGGFSGGLHGRDHSLHFVWCEPYILEPPVCNRTIS